MARSRKPTRPRPPRPSRKRRPARKPTRATRERQRKALVKKARAFGYYLAHRDDVIEGPVPVVNIEGGGVHTAMPLGIYGSRAEAEAARYDPIRGSFSSGLAVGLAAVAVAGLGVVLCYILFRKKDETVQGLAAPTVMPQLQPIIIQTGDNAVISPPKKEPELQQAEPEPRFIPVDPIYDY